MALGAMNPFKENIKKSFPFILGNYRAIKCDG